MNVRRWIAVLVLALTCSSAQAAYQLTAFTTMNIVSDNGVTYFYPAGATIVGTRLYNRLELRETADYYNNVENGRRMFAIILTAQLSGKLITIGYDDQDGPACRLAEVEVQW